VLYCENLLTVLYPTNPYLFYKLAETYASTNDAKKTRINLKKALDLGLKDASAIGKNPLFLKFRDDKKFADFLSSLKE